MSMLAGSRILITGGTGSFGSRVAARLGDLGARRVSIYSRDEKKQYDMRALFPDFDYVVGDVRDFARLRSAMRGVDYVFHAAALKQVPSCEDHPLEAVKTNVLGAENVCQAAVDAGVRAVVALSTDKAVKPVNAMGMAKALMEKIVCSMNRPGDDGTVFSCVRYGNVIGSRGSVIPFFQERIRAREPVLITSPGMTRFLMTLDQSVDLVLHALTSSRGGEVFVHRVPACTVADLARAICDREAGPNYPTVVVGPRPGEKIHEVLVNEYEIRRTTELGSDVYVVHPEYRLPHAPIIAADGYEYTSENTERLCDPEAIYALVERGLQNSRISMS